jgi:hypothetical protein
MTAGDFDEVADNAPPYLCAFCALTRPGGCLLLFFCFSDYERADCGGGGVADTVPDG